MERDYPLYSYHEIPEYMKHNRYVLAGYRVHLTVKQTIWSLFHIHNETLNVWTHLSAFIVFGWMLYVSLTTWMKEGSSFEKTLMAIYLLSAQTLFLCSTLFHLFHCLGPQQYTQLARCDYTGIAVLIAGSYYVPVYYLFSCQPMAFTFYALGITATGAAAVYVSYSPKFEAPGYESLRAGVFIAMSFFCVLMVPHVLLIHEQSVIAPLVARMILMGAWYLVGVLFYIFQIPERFFPGMFDLSCHSHVIWHCFVVTAAYQHYGVCQFAFESAAELHRSCLGV